MKKIYENYFQGHYLPKWISISAAFAYLLALVEEVHIEDGGKKVGEIDVTRRLRSYNVPDDDELIEIDSKSEENGESSRLYLSDINLSLMHRLADGSIESQGRWRETRREVVECHGPKYENCLTKDIASRKSRYETIDRSYWNDVWPYINYKDASVLVWEGDPEDVIDSYDYDGYSTSFLGGAWEGSAYAWKEECLDIQLRTSDLLESTRELFWEYHMRKSKKGDPNLSKEILKPKGMNRFYYSKTLGGWIIEFHGDVFQLPSAESRIQETMMQYILKNGTLDIDKGIKTCNWFLLDDIGTTMVVEDTEASVGIDTERVRSRADLMGGYDKTMEEEDITFFKENIKKLEKRLKRVKNDNEKEKLEHEINEANKYLKNSTWGNKGKTIDDFTRLKGRIKKRLSDFKRKIKPLTENFFNHLTAKIDDKHGGLIYRCDEKWKTEGE